MGKTTGRLEIIIIIFKYIMIQFEITRDLYDNGVFVFHQNNTSSRFLSTTYLKCQTSIMHFHETDCLYKYVRVWRLLLSSVDNNVIIIQTNEAWWRYGKTTGRLEIIIIIILKYIMIQF